MLSRVLVTDAAFLVVTPCAGALPGGTSSGVVLYCHLRVERCASYADTNVAMQVLVAASAFGSNVLVTWDKVALRSFIFSTVVQSKEIPI
jgi:hypothetical protein